MLKIDGSHGEGGGQILRTALALSSITSIPIEIENIRAGRSKPGLRQQHVTCVQAAADICDAEVLGGHIGSEKLAFRPGRAVRPGSYAWTVPTAGAVALVMQTVLLPLTLAKQPSNVEIVGGTHVPFSPTAHYLRDVYLPMLIQSGAELSMSMKQLGWNPKGGGEIHVEMKGSTQLKAQHLVNRGELERVFGVGLVSNLPAHIPQRMTDQVDKGLKAYAAQIDVRPIIAKGRGSGAAVCLTAEYQNGRAGFTVLGSRGMPSEEVADLAVAEFRTFDASRATVDRYLADQLLLILALATSESRFITPEVTLHLQTNKWVIQQFLERDIVINPETGEVKIVG